MANHKCSQNADKMQSKCRQNSVKIQLKFSQNAAKYQLKFSQVVQKFCQNTVKISLFLECAYSKLTSFSFRQFVVYDSVVMSWNAKWFQSSPDRFVNFWLHLFADVHSDFHHPDFVQKLRHVHFTSYYAHWLRNRSSRPNWLGFYDFVGNFGTILCHCLPTQTLSIENKTFDNGIDTFYHTL